MQITPKAYSSETDTFFLSSTSSVTLCQKLLQKQQQTTSLLIVLHVKPPLLPEFLIQHFNQLSSLFSLIHDQILVILTDISNIALKLNERVKLLQKYESTCKQTQKSLQSLQKLKQSSSLNNNRVDLHLADLQFLKSVEEASRQELDATSNVTRREVKEWRHGYESNLDQVLTTLVEKQLATHRQLISRLEQALHSSA